MELSEIILEAFNTLRVNKLRTALAVLGIVIGIGSVIALVSLGQASQKSVTNQIQSLGSNLLTVSPSNSQSGNVRGAVSVTTLTYDDAKAITTSSSVNTVAKVSPELSKRSQIVTGKNNTNTQVYGITPAYAEVKKVEITSGSFISQSDVDTINKVVVLGPQVVEDLFGDSAKNVIGEVIRIEGQSFRIVGVTKAKGGSGFQNQDDMVYVPLTTAQKVLYGQNYLSSISIEAKSADVMVTAQDQVGYLLLARHNLKDPAKADFRIQNQSDILSTASSITGIFTSLLSGIAAISLLVGGIGIMNIMLVTVTERTREVGLRKALGAKKKTIVTQFLTEAIILTIMGGFLGMLLGISISFILSKIMNLPFTVSASSIGLAIAVSGAIGIVFGWYPAKKASDLQPIEALRYE